VLGPRGVVVGPGGEGRGGLGDGTVEERAGADSQGFRELPDGLHLGILVFPFLDLLDLSGGQTRFLSESVAFPT